MTKSLEMFLAEHDHVISIELSDFKGSSPRERGTMLFVSSRALYGTIGGGQLEYLAIDEARRMMRLCQTERVMSIPLGPEIGQCCGGVVELRFKLMDNKLRNRAMLREKHEKDGWPEVYIFGAGHVGRALSAYLHLLPVKPLLIDSRAEELALSAVPVEQRCTPLPEAEVRSARPNSAFVILTHDHALDFLLAHEALMRGDAAYIGMIGSNSKRATFSNWLKRESPKLASRWFDQLTCPIGAKGSKDKRPAVIAAMVAAEVLTALDKAQRSLPATQQPI